MEDRRRSTTHTDGPAPDPLRELLETERLARLRAGEIEEAALREAEERGRAAHEAERRRAAEEAADTEEVESARILEMRRHRGDLDAEATVAQDVALRMLAGLGVPYSPGETTAGDLFEAPPLPRADAARRAGVPAARPTADPLLKGLKYAGMGGSLLLGTFGMGALLLRVPPKGLVHSPLLPLALGLGCVLVGGAYLAVVPTARRCGALAAGRPGSEEARGSLASLRALVAGVALTVALVDAKALAALDGARAMVDPASVPPFAVTLLVAAALSATYVVGAAVLAHSEGYAEEAEALVEAERAAHAHGWAEARRDDPEVRQAVEALGYAGTVERRRKELGREIEDAGAGLRRTLADAMGAAGKPPEPDDEARAGLRETERRARLAEARLAAHERHRPARGTRDGNAGGGAA